MEESWKISFQAKLDQHYSWPSLYIFKFIVPKNKVDELKSLFPMHTSTEKASNQGNYVSVTLQMMMPSSEAVIDVYQQASTIEGLIAL
jgi:uncharacterized protein